jgi:uncharacterized membrane protein YfcA
MLEISLILLILFLGSIIQGASGFGIGLVSMGLLSIFLTVKEGMLIILALTVVLSIFILLKLWKYILWKDIFPILMSSLAGRVVAFFFVAQFGESMVMKKWLGVVLILMVIYLYIKKKLNREVQLSDKVVVPILLGFIGGFIGGTFAVGGPFYVAYFLTRYKDKRHYNANLQVTFIVVNIFTLLIHGFQGDLTNNFFFYVLLGSIVVWFGVKQGLKWFDRMPTELIQKFTYTIIILAGVNLLIFS